MSNRVMLATSAALLLTLVGTAQAEVIVIRSGQVGGADLLKYIGETEQVLFTTTDLNLFASDFVEKAEVWKVESGRVER